MPIKRRAFLRHTIAAGLSSAFGATAFPPPSGVFVSLCGKPGSGYSDLPSNYSGLKEWLKTDTLVLNDGDAITAWADQSGQTNNASQVTGAIAPVYKTSIFGSSSVARFNGSSQFMTFGSGIVLAANCTIIGICSVTADSMLVGNTLANVQVRIKRSGANVLSLFDSNTEAVSSNFTSSASAVRMCTWNRSGGFTVFYEGGTSNGSSGNGTQSITLDGLGKYQFGNFYTGDLAELCIYNTDIGATAIASLYNNYFRVRYSTLT